ncbi:S1/P1 nuclease [Thalassotalea eurytherma]|uniref:Endonuclease n=1 Tax=Thalassotalea eurytherma TaxID=1144278 RepID=A0ABQ6H5M3_9GAMM|nr:S1/P1 nuclease [Thalassotalea eurytherma]GLX82809.1 endonuclease [Thalassotalea eurytherma]
MKIIIIAFILLTSTKSFAFGGYGHELICQMADQLLNQEQQHKIDVLVRQLPHHEKQLLVKGHKQLTFAKACNWPDKIKKMAKYDKYKPWHYLNTTRDDHAITSSDCQGSCVAKGVIYHQKKLAEGGRNQTQALLFLSHWVADLHQPLHVSYASDYGGNRTKVTYDKSIPKARCKNLHWYWDECLIMSKKLTVAQYTKMLMNNMPEQTKEQWQPSDVWEWADESYQLLQQASFGYCQHKAEKCLPHNNSVVITQAYQNQYLPIVEHQVILAAQRLATILSQTL